MSSLHGSSQVFPTYVPPDFPQREFFITQQNVIWPYLSQSNQIYPELVLGGGGVGC